MEKEKQDIEIKKYGYLTIFNSTRCDWKLSKKKEIRLKNIIKEIIKLEKEMDNLWKEKLWKEKK